MQTYKISFRKQKLIFMCQSLKAVWKGDVQRAGIADGGEIYNVQPRLTKAQYLFKCKNLKKMFNEEMSAGTNAEQSTKDETQLPSSPTSGNTDVVRSPNVSQKNKKYFNSLLSSNFLDLCQGKTDVEIHVALSDALTFISDNPNYFIIQHLQQKLKG